jgi:hypothetical protein
MGATMLMFRGFLIIFLAGLVGYTIAVIANHGWDLLSVFFGDMAAMGWPGQFNLDFLGFLALSALWVTWRHGFSPTGFALAPLAFFGGMGFLAPYLLIESIRHKGNVEAMLLGAKRAEQSRV